MTTRPVSLDAYRARRVHHRLVELGEARARHASQLYRVLCAGDEHDLAALVASWSATTLADALADCVADNSLVMLIVDADGEGRPRRWPAQEAA